MPTIVLRTEVPAPPAVVFDLARSVDLHTESTAHTNERAVAGRTEGLIELGESVTWEATHFGLRQQLTAKIVDFNPPTHFRDTMVKGAFKRFDHEHRFEAIEGGTLMTDVFDYTSPLGPLGHLADWLFLKRYMTKLLTVRNQVIADVARSGRAETFRNTTD